MWRINVLFNSFSLANPIIGCYCHCSVCRYMWNFLQWWFMILLFSTLPLSLCQTLSTSLLSALNYLFYSLLDLFRLTGLHTVCCNDSESNVSENHSETSSLLLKTEMQLLLIKKLCFIQSVLKFCTVNTFCKWVLLPDIRWTPKCIRFHKNRFNLTFIV